jgi:hypothetical protein
MNVTTTLALLGGLCAALGCKDDKAAAPAPTTPSASGTAAEPPEKPATDPAPAGSAAVAPGSGATAPDAGAKYGACDLQATGAFDFQSHIENQRGAVLTGHWQTAATKAANDKLVADAEARGETYRTTEQPLSITCQDVPRGVFVRFSPTLSKLSDIKPAPQDFPIVRVPDDRPGVMRAEVRMRDGGIHVVAGGLHVTTWQQGELVARFELDIETFDEPAKKAKLTGTFTYHCADDPRCGAK